MAEAQQQQQPALRITTWNVLNSGYECEDYYDAAAHPFLHWDQGRGERVCAYAKQLDSDIYCLQEVSHAMARQIQEALGSDDDGDAYGMMWLPRTQAHATTEDGLATLYRKRRVVYWDRFVWRYPSGNHIALACLFVCDGDEFWCVNTHTNWTTREEDLVALQHMIETNQQFSVALPKLVMGDFNAERTEAWYAQLGKHGLVDATPMWATTGPYSYNSGKVAKWIDYVLLHKLATVQRIVVGGDNCFTDRALPSAEIPSDHLPLTIVMDMRVLKEANEACARAEVQRED